MGVKNLNVRISLRNDSAAAWSTNNPILDAGEAGIEMDTNKFKFGNGIDHWKDLPYAGADENQILNLIAAAEDNHYALTADTEDDTTILATINEPKKGDTATVKRMLAEDKESYTGYVYNGEQWAAMDGNYNADNVILTDDIIMAGNYDKVGNLTKSTNGTATFATAGKSIAAALTEIFSKRLQPSITSNPKVSLTFSQAKAYEVGTEVTPSYSATLSAGTYTYGPATGITATSWEVTDTDSHSATTASGSFDKFTVADGESYKITAKATYGEGAVAQDNLGATSDPVVKIAAGSTSATSSAVTGYRNSFYGTVTNKDSAPTSAIIRNLTKSGKALANGNSFTVDIPVGALRVIIAYPATLREVNSIKDVNGLNAEIKSGFTMSTVAVEGANSYSAINYRVYVMDYANPNDKANKYTVQI